MCSNERVGTVVRVDQLQRCLVKSLLAVNRRLQQRALKKRSRSLKDNDMIAAKFLWLTTGHEKKRQFPFAEQHFMSPLACFDATYEVFSTRGIWLNHKLMLLKLNAKKKMDSIRFITTLFNCLQNTYPWCIIIGQHRSLDEP